MPAIDLSAPGRRIHVVGIGGSGMSAIATVLAAMGHRVSGSDLKPSAGLERLRALGVEVHVGHRAEHIGDAEVVTCSTAVPARNPEVTAARERGTPVLRRAEILAAITATRRTAAVAGTHGKTTTTSMLALVLTEAGLAPSWIVGGEVNETGGNALWTDKSDLLVVEADESDGTFLELGANAVIVTNIEPDHLDYYGSVDRLQDAFGRFVAAAPGPRLVCADDPVAAAIGAEAGAVSYGTAEGADYRMVDLVASRAGTRFTVVHDGRTVADISVPIPGRYNASNACAALVAGHFLGAPMEAGARALARYGGVARRFQFRGERGGVTFVDDYAHLPGEVSSVLSAAVDGRWRRIVCVFQPHRYTRTGALWRDFADAFEAADLLVVTDVFPAGETPVPGVTGKLIVEAVLGAHPYRRVAYLPNRQDLIAYLHRELRPGALCLTLGAGDITSLPDELQGADR